MSIYSKDNIFSKNYYRTKKNYTFAKVINLINIFKNGIQDI